MKPQRVFLAVSLMAASVAIGAVQTRAPRFEVDALWPKPLPNHWVLGSVVGLAIDARDRIYVLTDSSTLNKRTEIGAASRPPTGDCCLPAPNVLVLDTNGNVVSSFTPAIGPRSPNGIAVDAQGNIWIGGRDGTDTQLFKYSSTGQLLQQIGKAADSATIAAAAVRQAADTAYTGVSGARPAAQRPAVSLPANNSSLEAFGGAAGIAFDATTGEAFVADGYRNSRVAVVDTRTGTIKRVFGEQLGVPVTCAELSRAGLLYVCDRSRNRIQIYRKNGALVNGAEVASNTRANGSVWDIAFSPDQRFMYVADGANMKVHILDRASLRTVGSFGTGGRYPGQFYAVHSIVVDSRGNVYTGEALEGKRIQKWTAR